MLKKLRISRKLAENHQFELKGRRRDLPRKAGSVLSFQKRGKDPEGISEITRAMA